LAVHRSFAHPPTFAHLAANAVPVYGASKFGARHREKHLNGKRTFGRNWEPDQPDGKGLDAASIQKQTTDQRLAGQSFGLVKALRTG
jgi:hypothetical protein